MQYITVPPDLLEGDATRARQNPCAASAVHDIEGAFLRAMEPLDANTSLSNVFFCTRPKGHEDEGDLIHIAHGLDDIQRAWVEPYNLTLPSELATLPFRIYPQLIEAGVMRVDDEAVCSNPFNDGLEVFGRELPWFCTRTPHEDHIHLAGTDPTVEPIGGLIATAWVSA